jgi:hypothetical protein
MRVAKEVVDHDHLDLAKESLREAGGMMVHRLKVGVEEVGDHLDLAGEAAKMISSAH